MRPEIIHGREQEYSPSAVLSLFQAARACSPSITCTYPRLGCTRADVSFWPKRTFELVAIKSAFTRSGHSSSRFKMAFIWCGETDKRLPF